MLRGLFIAGRWRLTNRRKCMTTVSMALHRSLNTNIIWTKFIHIDARTMHVCTLNTLLKSFTKDLCKGKTRNFYFLLTIERQRSQNLIKFHGFCWFVDYSQCLRFTASSECKQKSVWTMIEFTIRRRNSVICHMCTVYTVTVYMTEQRKIKKKKTTNFHRIFNLSVFSSTHHNGYLRIRTQT